jgi:ATP-dependent exoDNAse (exonuclease V) beta subunit
VAAYFSTARSAELDDIDAIVTEAIARFRQLLSRKDVREIYLSGEPYHEVPFTMQVEGRIVRGTIDCLIAAANRVTVLEFKTGKPRHEHQAQADVYRAAAEALFPGVQVDSRLVYTSDATA